MHYVGAPPEPDNFEWMETPMEKLQITATFPTIAAADLDEFKKLIAQAIEDTRGEPDNLQYEWFFNEDQTKCIVRETYADSNALLTHIANMGSVLGQMAEKGGGLEVEVFGSPSAELAETAAAFEASVYPFFAST
jgi:quinol monooxygenase YgiN